MCVVNTNRRRGVCREHEPEARRRSSHGGGAPSLSSVSCPRTPLAQALEGRLALIAGTSTCHMASSVAPCYARGVWGPYWGEWLRKEEGPPVVVVAAAAARGSVVLCARHRRRTRISVGRRVAAAPLSDRRAPPHTRALGRRAFPLSLRSPGATTHRSTGASFLV